MNALRSFPLSASLLLCLAFLVCGCGKNGVAPNETARHYEVRGLVRGLLPDHRMLEVEHEDIPGFMPSMTMPFLVRDGKEIAGIGIGDALAFRLNVTERDSWIDQLRKIEPSGLKLPRPTATPQIAAAARLREGDSMPAFQLVDQNGQRIELTTFLGHPFVMTFIFTRCPIPNFCPRMTHDFAELQKAIKGSSAGPLASTQLLSVSFDPEHDTPAVLTDYARGENADPAVWKFATGDAAEIAHLTKGFSILVQPEGGSISHSLATALVDQNGRITKIWRGNGWTPQEVIQEISTGAR